MADGPPPPSSAWRSPRRRGLAALIALAAVTGVGLRIWLLAGPTGAFDSDEAVVGLIARHALYDGEFSTFFWNQFYGGTLEPLLSVPLFLAVGAEIGAVKAVPMALIALSALLVWRLGRATVGEPAATLAACVFFAGPANLVWVSTKGRGFYGVTMVAGLAFLLCALRLARDPARTRDWLLLGLVGGIGIWASPLVLYFAVPGVIWLAVHAGRQVWRAVLAVPTGILGGLPWLLFNIERGFPSLERPAGFVTDQGYAANTALLAKQGVPVALGLHAGERWLLLPAPLMKAVYLAVVVVTAALVLRRLHAARFVVLYAVSFALLWGIFPSSGVIGEGRYLFPLLPALVLLLAHAAAQFRLGPLLLVGAVVVLSVAGAVRIRHITEPYAGDVRTPHHVGPLVAFLTDRGIDRVYANYWVAYRVAFESREEIIATPPDASARYNPYVEALAAAPRPGFVFPAGSADAARFGQGLANLGVPAERWEPGEFVVYRPDRRVEWADVFSAAG